MGHLGQLKWDWKVVVGPDGKTASLDLPIFKPDPGAGAKQDPSKVKVLIKEIFYHPDGSGAGIDESAPLFNDSLSNVPNPLTITLTGLGMHTVQIVSWHTQTRFHTQHPEHITFQAIHVWVATRL
jgi:hypothetical protein